MFLCVFAWAKRRSGEIAKFQFLIPANLGVTTKKVREKSRECHNHKPQPPKKSQKVLVTVVFLLVYFAVLSLVFELKQI